MPIEPDTKLTEEEIEKLQNAHTNDYVVANHLNLTDRVDTHKELEKTLKGTDED